MSYEQIVNIKLYKSRYDMLLTKLFLEINKIKKIPISINVIQLSNIFHILL